MTGPGYGRILREHGIAPKKRLGQHFMIDPALLEAIADAMLPSGEEWIALELGAGIGTLTRALASRADKVLAVEMDRDLAPAIEQTCGDLGNVEVVWGDALDCDLSGCSLQQNGLGGKLALCGNLPYYITSQVLYEALVKRPCWSRLAFVVQEEVGVRMASPSGSKAFGRLSLWCQYRASVKIEKRLSRGCFIPRPDVDSCLVSLDVRPTFPMDEAAEKALDRISQAVFSKRRKTLLNGLRELYPDRDRVARALLAAGLDPGARPEQLSVGDYVKLVEALETNCREI